MTCPLKPSQVDVGFVGLHAYAGIMGNEYSIQSSNAR